ncbi:hypothetical protein [Vibrio crassostreae]|uniref:hypothetical protein n=1 Tax=Vibrio crassostreae TaxID=246167 RepID=UPI000632850B|nr:hypothetical protein [Vibrio crassostreae]CDT33552.1 conserved hypothetical protein [Vibrio crassostreae]
MNKYQATLFSNESDIFTALHSNKQKMTDLALRKLAFKRGLILPKELERDDLVERISDLPFAYEHVRYIQDRLASETSQELYSIKRIYEGFDIEKLPKVLEKVIAGRPKMLGSENIVPNASIKSYNVKIAYTEFDFKRGKFQQKKLYGGDIWFIVHKDYVSVRYNYTKRISTILDEIIDTYKADVSKDIVINEIDMSTVIDADFRNMFAQHLYDFDGIYKTSGFSYAGLEKVRVSRIKVEGEQPKKPEEKVLVDGSDDDQEDEFEDETKQDDEENLTFNINNAAYDGQSLVDTTQINELCKVGFYRSHIRWKSKATFLKNNPMVVFELGFDEKYLAKDIKFKVLHKELTDGSTEKIGTAEFDKIIIKLEEKIFLINDFIIEELGKRYPSTEDTQELEVDKQEAG